MTLSLLCDEQIPYPVIEGLRRRGIDAKAVQEVGLQSATDKTIVEVACRERWVIYTRDSDFLRHHSTGVRHAGIFYHHSLAYSIGESIRRLALACEAFSAEEMQNNVKFL
jgi:hypothetical protein